MPHFIECDDGWVNLDHVARIEYQQCRNPGLLFCDADGRPIGKTNCPRGFDLDEAVARVVPAGVGATAVIISAFCGETSLGRPDETYTVSAPIAAWRLAYGVAMPVFLEEPVSDDRIFFALPDGQLMEPDNSTFNTMADAQADVLRRAQGAWDRKHATDKAPPV